RGGGRAGGFLGGVIIPAVKQARCRLVLEPGRFIVGNAGVLLSRVLYTKESGGKHFLIQDAAMNDLIRPTLYDSFHRIWPAEPRAPFPAPPEDYETDIPGTLKQDVVGPVCESGDFLAKNRALPPMTRGDLLVTFSAGAYGMSMSSNYNGRPRAAEVLVDGGKDRLIRRRETYEDLVRPELEVKAFSPSPPRGEGVAGLSRAVFLRTSRVQNPIFSEVRPMFQWVCRITGCLALLLFFLAPAQSQVEDYRQYFKPPDTVQEYWTAIKFELELGAFKTAATYIKGFMAKPPTEKDLLEIE